MKTAAVICEFNPFHNGHKYLIDTIKKHYADRVVCIMSGSFVQRGDVAICDKYARAKATLDNGCDIVVELPTVFAVSNAQCFAKGGVEIAKAMGADMLCFGTDSADINTLRDICDIFDDDVFNNKVAEYMNKGMYYPKAVSLSIESTLSPTHARAMDDANCTLAVEYMKALKDTDITPVAIKRTGVSHDSTITVDNIASASHIRELIKSGDEYKQFTDMAIDQHADLKTIESAIMYKLKIMSKAELEQLPDVSEGLHNRLYDCARRYNSLDELLSALKTKRYTLARLRRIVVYALLGITKEDVQISAQYIRVLGMNDNGAEILSNGCKLPIVGKVHSDVNKLNEKAKRMFEIDVTASEIYSLCSGSKACANDYTAKVIKV